MDSSKIRAKQKMPPPSDVTAVQHLFGLAQYLSKFFPHLSELTKPLRELTRKGVVWTWGPAQQQAIENLKKAVTSTPVLSHYNLQEEVTLQCEVSQSGMGAALMQNSQPVAYALRALTPTEMQYAQIEKELLAIVFGASILIPTCMAEIWCRLKQVINHWKLLCRSLSIMPQVGYNGYYSGYKSPTSRSDING